MSDQNNSTDLTPMQIKFLTEFANNLVWKNPNTKLLKFDSGIEYNELVKILQDHISNHHAKRKLILPNLTAYDNKTVGIFSDYSGESSGDYNTYSFLVCSLNNLGLFLNRVKEIRIKEKLGEKEISFKDFRMGQIRNALPEYLKAANNFLHGFLFTVIIDKKLITLFGPNERKTLTDLSNILKENGLGTWKPEVAEKLLRVIHIVSFLTALLARTGQNVFWMSDNDTICPNDKLHKYALDLFSRVVSIYAKESYFSNFGGATPFKERSLDFLDLLSLADVTASSIEHYLTRKKYTKIDNLMVKSGADDVLKWLAHDGISLSKMAIKIDKNNFDGIDTSILEFNLDDEPDNLTIIPIVF